MVRNRDCASRMAPPGGNSLPFAGLARARFELGLASSGMAASWKKGFEGKNLPPAKAVPGFTS